MPKPKIKKLIFLIVLLVLFYLLSQIIIYAFFAESKIVKIDANPIMDNDININIVKKEWRGNQLVIKAYKNWGCEEPSYIRYNKNKIEILTISRTIKCWGSDYQNYNFILEYNNIISAGNAYLSNDELLIHNSCDIDKNNCIIDGNIITNAEQAKDYGFIRLGKYESLDLRNLDHSLISRKSVYALTPEQNKKHAERSEELNKIMFGLKKYYDKNNNSYPISKNISKISDSDSEIYKALKEFVNEEYLIDPEYPEFYYGYRSTDGRLFELFFKLENPEGKCKKEQGLCIISSEDIKYTYPTNK